MIEESTTLRKGTIKRLHVDQHRIRTNAKNGTNEPAITVQARGGPYKGHRVQIQGPSELIYDPGHPLSCGAKCWIETTAEVEIVVEP